MSNEKNTVFPEPATVFLCRVIYRNKRVVDPEVCDQMKKQKKKQKKPQEQYKKPTRAIQKLNKGSEFQWK